MRRRVIQGDHPDLAGSLNNVGYCLQILGRPAEALRHYEESLAMRRRLFPGDHPDVATAISGVARCHVALGRPADALPLLEEVLAMNTRIGDTGRGAANALDNLASCLEDLKRAGDALPLREEALAILRRTCAGDDPDLATAVGNLGYCLMALGRLKEALARFEEAAEMGRRLFPGGHRDAVARLGNMASCLSKLGREREARPLYEEALAMSRRLFGGDHPDVATSLDNLGCCRKRLGATADALPLLKEALAMRRRLGDDHPDVVVSLNNVGLALHDVGRPHQALPFLEESLAIRRRLWPCDDVDVASGLNNLGLCLTSLGRPVEALRFHEESLAMIRRLGGDDRQLLAGALGNVALATLDVGRAADALPLFEEALATQRRAVDGDHADIALGLSNLALCLQDLGRTTQALPLFEESLAMFRRLFEGDHPMVTAALSNVGTCLGRLGRNKEVVPLHEAALAMSRRLCGGEDARVARQEMNLAMSLIGAGRTDEGWRHLEEAVQVARRVAWPDLYAALANAAATRLEAGEAAAALALAEEAVDRVEVLRAEAAGLTDADRARYFAQLKRFGAFDLAVAALRTLGRDGDAVRFIERARARSLLDTLDRARIDALAEARRRAEERGDAALLGRIDAAQTSLDATETDVARLTHALATVGLAGPGSEERREEARKLTAGLAAARRAQQEALRQRAHLIRDEFAAARPADAAALQRLAGADGRVLEYAVSEEESTLFVVPPEGSAIRAFRLAWRDGTAVTSKSLAEKVEAYGARMRAGGGEARGWFEEEAKGGGGVSGSELFEVLVPAEVREDVLRAKVVYVVADGALNRLPFETLVVAPGTFWLEGGPPLVYGASGSALLWSRERRDKQIAEGRLDGAVVVGDPVFRPAVEPPATGILVTGVAPEGQASRLGMQAGDVILAYDGKEIADIKALSEARAAVEGSGRQIALAVWRAGERKDLAVEAGALGVNVAPDAMPEAWRRFQLGDPALARAALERTADLSRYGELKPLPGTRREAEAIAEALKGMQVTLLLGESATHPAVLRAAPAARYLHFATHGLADETEMASYSSLALTLPAVPAAEDDGFLSLEDLFSRWRGKLQGCELVVLSACETQKGRIQKDEAVQALPVGFLFAGAPTVIATLWRVDDASAAELMGDFYRRLALGKGKLEAFTEARKALRKRHPDPCHWAPFVYIGDPR
jgi:tetratricopeptide (TPR) repeat protein